MILQRFWGLSNFFQNSSFLFLSSATSPSISLPTPSPNAEPPFHHLQHLPILTSRIHSNLNNQLSYDLQGPIIHDFAFHNNNNRNRRKETKDYNRNSRSFSSAPHEHGVTSSSSSRNLDSNATFIIHKERLCAMFALRDSNLSRRGLQHWRWEPLLSMLVESSAMMLGRIMFRAFVVRFCSATSR